MRFKEALETAPAAVREACKPGKQALKGEHRGNVDCNDTKRFLGSFDLDAAYAKHQPNANRWDYGLGFLDASGDHAAIWIEVHPATTGEVVVVLEKHKWLLNWLRTEALDLARLSTRRSGGKSFFWLAASAGVHIRPGSPQARRLQQTGLDLPRHKITFS